MRLAERQLAKAFVLLCQNDAGDDGEHVAVWLYCSGNERRHTAEQGRIGLLGQDGFFLSTPYEADRWHEVEVYLDWTRKSLRLAVDGVVVVEDGGGENEVSFRDRSVDGVSVLRLCNKDVAQVWFDSVSLSDDADAPPPRRRRRRHRRRRRRHRHRRRRRRRPQSHRRVCGADNLASALSAEMLARLSATRHSGPFPTMAVRHRGEDGLLVYTHQLRDDAPSAALQLRDAAIDARVFIDGRQIGTLPAAPLAPSLQPVHRREPPTMELEAAAGARLQLLMHVGVRPSREPLLGVSECVSLGIAPLFGWEVAWVPISGVARAAAAAPPVADALPPPPGAPLPARRPS